MKLDHLTWREVEAYLKRSDGIIIPTGSIEQHGPMGLIGTDAICAQAIADGAAEIAGAISAPCLAYAPAPFNMAFPGTISLSPHLFAAMAQEIVSGLASQGFRHFYFLNGHGANLEPLRGIPGVSGGALRIRSWWDFEPVNVLRRQWYGDWEGMHATPSEVAITQALHRVVDPGAEALNPPEKLTPAFMAAHAGDRHGPPEQHREAFPDGRVGSHSALARPEHGHSLLNAARAAVAADYATFLAEEAS